MKLKLKLKDVVLVDNDPLILKSDGKDVPITDDEKPMSWEYACRNHPEAARVLIEQMKYIHELRA